MAKYTLTEKEYISMIILFNTLLKLKGVIRMSEAIVSRRGWGEGGKPELRTETITGNTNLTVPNYRYNRVSVRIFGGGGEEEVDNMDVVGVEDR